MRLASRRAASAKLSPPDAYKIAREELTMMGAPSRQPARTVANASPPCAPTPGISRGRVGRLCGHVQFQPGKSRPLPGPTGRFGSMGPAPGGRRVRTAGAGLPRWQSAGFASHLRRGWTCDRVLLPFLSTATLLGNFHASNPRLCRSIFRQPTHALQNRPSQPRQH